MSLGATNVIRGKGRWGHTFGRVVALGGFDIDMGWDSEDALKIDGLQEVVTISGTDTTGASKGVVPAYVNILGGMTEVTAKSSGCTSATIDVGRTTEDEDEIADGVAVTADAIYNAFESGNITSYPVNSLGDPYTIKVTPNAAPGAGESFSVRVTYFWYELALKNA